MEKMIELIDAVSKSDLTGFKYEEEGIKLHLSKKENTCYVTENLSAPVNAVTTSAAEIKKAAEGDQISGTSAEETPVGNVVESPLVGTFYAAPAEDAESFVKVGDRVEKGQTLGIVEAMKLMNEIESDDSGTVAEIRDNEMKRIPYMLIVGEKEAENGEVAVRKQGEGDKGTMKIEEFGKNLAEEVSNMINKW